MVHRIQLSADLTSLIFGEHHSSLSLHRSAQGMMGCAVLFQTHCTSSTPSAGRQLPPPSRACPTPPPWCEPDPWLTWRTLTVSCGDFIINCVFYLWPFCQFYRAAHTNTSSAKVCVILLQPEVVRCESV